MAVEWQELDAATSDACPVPTKQSEGDADWEQIVAALAAGKVVKLPYTDDKELRGKRLSLGRRAVRRGFEVELRYGGRLRRGPQARRPPRRDHRGRRRGAGGRRPHRRTPGAAQAADAAGRSAGRFGRRGAGS